MRRTTVPVVHDNKLSCWSTALKSTIWEEPMKTIKTTIFFLQRRRNSPINKKRETKLSREAMWAGKVGGRLVCASFIHTRAHRLLGPELPQLQLLTAWKETSAPSWPNRWTARRKTNLTAMLALFFVHCGFHSRFCFFCFFPRVEVPSSIPCHCCFSKRAPLNTMVCISMKDNKRFPLGFQRFQWGWSRLVFTGHKTERCRFSTPL